MVLPGPEHDRKKVSEELPAPDATFKSRNVPAINLDFSIYEKPPGETM